MFRNEYMQLALKEAEKAGLAGEVPVGAIILYKNEVISAAFNKVENQLNPLAHAEMIAIAAACHKIGEKYLIECDIYVSLEPCPMCATAISFARISRLYFGAYDIKSGGVESGPRVLDSTSCHHRPEIYGGILEGESRGLLQAFFKERR